MAVRAVRANSLNSILKIKDKSEREKTKHY